MVYFVFHLQEMIRMVEIYTHMVDYEARLADYNRQVLKQWPLVI